MKIEWNKVTWYSWTLTGIVFLILIPSLTLYFISQFRNIPSFSPQTYFKPVTKETYTFDEFVPPNENMSYELVKLPSGNYGLNIDGFQTMTRIKAHAEGAGQDSSRLIFDSYDKENVGGVFKKGDLLFTYTFGTSSNEILILRWEDLRPINPKNLSGSVFIYHSKDKKISQNCYKTCDNATTTDDKIGTGNIIPEMEMAK